jgi:hypothetical protein
MEELFKMYTYSVAPNVDLTSWVVKLEGVAPEEEHNTKEEAVEAAERMAKENKPSEVQIFDENHDVIEKRRFE